MTDQPEKIDLLRKKLLWRANHRGMKEMDIMLGGYATKHLGGMSASQLEQFASLLDVSDAQLSDWLTNKTPTPEKFKTDLFARIKQQSFLVTDYKKL